MLFSSGRTGALHECPPERAVSTDQFRPKAPVLAWCIFMSGQRPHEVVDDEVVRCALQAVLVGDAVLHGESGKRWEADSSSPHSGRVDTGMV